MNPFSAAKSIVTNALSYLPQPIQQTNQISKAESFSLGMLYRFLMVMTYQTIWNAGSMAVGMNLKLALQVYLKAIRLLHI